MIETKISSRWKKTVNAVSDAAKIGSKEIKRGVKEAKNQLNKLQLLQRRKELFAELGRGLYEASEDGLPKAVAHFLQTTELHEIVSDIKKVDDRIANINIKSKKR